MTKKSQWWLRLRGLLLLCALLLIVAYLHSGFSFSGKVQHASHSDKAKEKLSTIQVNTASQKTAISASSPQKAETSVKPQAVAIRPSLSEAEKKYHYQRNINILAADPSITPASLELQKKILSVRLWGKDAVIPETTAADRIQQQQLRKVLLQVREQSGQIRRNQTMNSAQKEQAVRKLLDNYMQQVNAIRE